MHSLNYNFLPWGNIVYNDCTTMNGSVAGYSTTRILLFMNVLQSGLNPSLPILVFYALVFAPLFLQSPPILYLIQ